MNRPGLRRLALTAALLLLPCAAWPAETSRFAIGDVTLEAPVANGFCVSDDRRLADRAAKNLSGMVAVLAMHVRCTDLEIHQAGGRPERMRLRFWGVALDNGQPMRAGPQTAFEMQALAALIRRGSDREHRALATGIQRSLNQGGMELRCISMNAEEDILGGQLCLAEPEGRQVDLAAALRPVLGYMLVAVLLHLPGGGPFTPDFSQAAAMMTTLREVE